MKYLSLIVLLCALVLNGCTTNPEKGDPPPVPRSIQSVFVLNEGNYGHNNSTLTVYALDSAKAYQDVFGRMNGRSLGDVGNDICVDGHRVYIVMNNSQRIEAMDDTAYHSLGSLTIPGSKSPFKMALVSSSKAYVTNLYDASVTAFNPSTMTILKERISVGGNPRGVLVYNGKAYVCNSGYGTDSTISVIDVTTDAVVKTITVAPGVAWIGVSGENKLVAACEGYYNWTNPALDVPGALALIDPVRDTVTALKKLALASFGHPGGLAVGVNGYGYLLHGSGVMRFGTAALALSDTLFIPVTGYGIAIDQIQERILITDARNFTASGYVMLFDKTGTQKARFDAGIGPQAIAFKYQ